MNDSYKLSFIQEMLGSFNQLNRTAGGLICVEDIEDAVGVVFKKSTEQASKHLVSLTCFQRAADSQSTSIDFKGFMHWMARMYTTCDSFKTDSAYERAMYNSIVRDGYLYSKDLKALLKAADKTMDDAMVENICQIANIDSDFVTFEQFQTFFSQIASDATMKHTSVWETYFQPVGWALRAWSQDHINNTVPKSDAQDILWPAPIYESNLTHEQVQSCAQRLENSLAEGIQLFKMNKRGRLEECTFYTTDIAHLGCDIVNRASCTAVQNGGILAHRDPKGRYDCHNFIFLHAIRLATSNSLYKYASPFFLELCKNKATASWGFQLVFSTETLELVAMDGDQYGMVIHGLPYFLGKPNLRLYDCIKESEGLVEKPSDQSFTADISDLMMTEAEPENVPRSSELDLEQMASDAFKGDSRMSMVDDVEWFLEELITDQTRSSCPNVRLNMHDRSIVVSLEDTTIPFQKDSCSITDEYKLVLSQVAKVMKAMGGLLRKWMLPQCSFSIEGHTNNQKKKNQADSWHVKVSYQRACVVETELGLLNIDKNLLLTKGQGGKNPLIEKSDKRNNRIEFMIVVPKDWEMAAVKLRLRGKFVHELADYRVNCRERDEAERRKSTTQMRRSSVGEVSDKDVEEKKQNLVGENSAQVEDDGDDNDDFEDARLSLLDEVEKEGRRRYSRTSLPLDTNVDVEMKVDIAESKDEMNDDIKGASAENDETE
eukprot:CAMPEP_0185797408 /NCGR_PEP_ID=MMETSP1174-20130828/161599_1 /TAXON_ID=35687 /ORGANISM="Dictyocha speculum, Strain CCMP1381" /LENGTH=714 /DNA_ID=CAMNT_0028492839 /DNA_START=542 /DNA_END=2686 /DNA_ORIENTATION=-